MITKDSQVHQRRSNNPIIQDEEQGWMLHDNPLYLPNSQQELIHCTSRRLLIQNRNSKPKSSSNIAATCTARRQQQPPPLRGRRSSLPLSARALAASFRDFSTASTRHGNYHNSSSATKKTKTKSPPPQSAGGLDAARAQIAQLKDELELEKKAHRRTEILNNELTEELVEERRAKEAAERLCAQLCHEISGHKSEVERLRRALTEEKDRERMAAEDSSALLVLLLNQQQSADEAARTNPAAEGQVPSAGAGTVGHGGAEDNSSGENSTSAGESKRPILREKNHGVVRLSILSSSSSPSLGSKRGSPEAENPHIKRGIKGLVEFPRVMRAIGSKKREVVDASTIMKLECQKAQMRILLRQRSTPLPSTSSASQLNSTTSAITTAPPAAASSSKQIP